MSTSGKKSLGLQKIEMKKIENESNLQVTFSKRRSGLFKKASELCTLCGVDMALIIYSPSKKVYSFGNPSVEAVIERYLSRGLSQPSRTMRYIEAQRNANVRELNSRLSQIKDQLETERKHGDNLKHQRNVVQTQHWFARQIDEMDRTQLEQFREALDGLMMQIAHYRDMFHIQGATTASNSVINPPIHQFFDVGPSTSVIHLHHPPPAPQLPPPTFFQGSVMQNQHFFGGYNDMSYDFSATNPPIHPFYDVGPSTSMIRLHHPPPPPVPQVSPPTSFQGPVMQNHHFFGGYNNMGGYGGPPPGFD